MRIIILGAGQVGASVAEALSSEANDITIVDQSREALGDLADRLDVRTLVGNGALPSVLKSAGMEDADMLVAVTQSDATNLVACKIARSVFNVTTRVARLRSADYLKDKSLLDDEHFGVTHAICPEQEITDYIARLIDFPEALQVLEFADGRVTLVCVRAYEGGLLVGKPIKAMREHLPTGVDARIAAIFREHQSVDPEGNTIVEAGDEVFVLAAGEHIRPVMRELRRMLKPVRRVMIAGGGNIGARVALALEGDHDVKVIERNPARAEHVATRLQRTLVLHGEATDENVLAQENIDEMDMFLALTNDDEDNIMAASLAKRLGCSRVLAPDQSPRLRRHGAGRADRHRPLAGAGVDRLALDLLPPRRRGARAQPAPRRRRSTGAGGAWRPQQQQGGGAPHRRAAGDQGRPHRRHRARHRRAGRGAARGLPDRREARQGDHSPPRHGDRGK
jgi:trk system potassium uptake protein TrkA